MNRAARDLVRQWRVEPGEKARLSRRDPAATPGVSGEAEAEAATKDRVRDLDKLQYRLHAEGRQSLLIVLQGMDASGKDGVVRKVMTGFDPAGCHVHSFKAPTAEERAHDFLWRLHAHTPAAGEVAIWNRSHYEDVLIVRVRELAPKSVWSKRFAHIEAFERLLADSGTRVLKCCLHISREEQRQRLLARVRNPDKRWKFNEGDLEERALWDDYQAAYEDALSRTSSEHAPWYVIPADHKWYRDWAISTLVLGALEDMAPRIPEPSLDLARLEARLRRSSPSGPSPAPRGRSRSPAARRRSR